MKASEYIRAGMKHLANGWCQGHARDGNGNVCAYGALGVVTRRMQADDKVRNLNQSLRAVNLLEEYAKELGHNRLIAMNDAPTTTQQDMLNLFEKAALTLEEHGE